MLEESVALSEPNYKTWRHLEAQQRGCCVRILFCFGIMSVRTVVAYSNTDIKSDHLIIA